LMNLIKYFSMTFNETAGRGGGNRRDE